MGGFMEVSAIHSIVISEETLKFELLTYLTGNYPFRLGKGTVKHVAQDVLLNF